MKRPALIFIFAVLLAAFGLRMTMLDVVRHINDCAFPLGQGIEILEKIGAGRWSELPLFSLASGIRVVNPAGASYLWALVELFSRHPYIATALSAMLNTLAVALVFDLGRRIFGVTPGLIAAIVAAASPWVIYTARCTWIQGQLEFACALVLWLIVVAFKTRRRALLVAAFLVTAVAMQTYLLAMFLAVQAAAACLIAFITRPDLRRRFRWAFVSGVAICAVGAGLFGALLFTRTDAALADLDAGVNRASATADGGPLDVSRYASGLQFALQIASGHDFDRQMTDAAEPSFARRDGLNTARSAVITIMIVAGLIVTAALALRRRSRHDYWLTLVWFGLPVAVALVAAIALPRLGLVYQYLLLASPAGYLLAGASWLMVERARLRPAYNRAAVVVFGACAFATAAVSLNAQTSFDLRQPFTVRLDDIPMRHQLALAQTWRAQCAEIVNPQLLQWTASAYGTTQDVRSGGSQVNGSSDVWQVRPQGGSCVSRVSADPTPLHAEALAPLQIADDAAVITYRSRPIREAELISSTTATAFEPLWLNLDWSLLSLNSTPSAGAGEAITVTHVWRIDGLPQEPFANWYYPIFVHLVSPAGERITLADGAPSIAGRLWRAGDYILSTLRATLPEDLPPGNYELQLSLFDPVQKRNAVYFDRRAMDQPIVAIPRPLKVMAR